MTRKPAVTSSVLRGIELLLRDPGSVGALFGVATVASADELRDLRKVERWARRMREWKTQRGETDPTPSERQAELMAVHAKAKLLDDVVRGALTHTEASRRFDAIEGKRARLAAGAPERPQRTRTAQTP